MRGGGGEEQEEGGGKLIFGLLVGDEYDVSGMSDFSDLELVDLRSALRIQLLQLQFTHLLISRIAFRIIQFNDRLVGIA